MLAAAVISVGFLRRVGGANSTLNQFHIQSCSKLVANPNYSILLIRILEEKRFVHNFPMIFHATAKCPHIEFDRYN